MKELRKLSLTELFKLRTLLEAEIGELGVKVQSELNQLNEVNAEIERKQDINVNHN